MEKDSRYYDEAFLKPQYSLSVNAEHSWHADLYKYVRSILNKKEFILELGCGTGQFAESLIKNGYNYGLGVDFSPVGVGMSIKRCGVDRFKVADLYDYKIDNVYDTIVSLEVMEHLDRDRYVLSCIPKGKRVVFSVPNFGDVAHVRFFTSMHEISERYNHLFDVMTIIPVGRYFVSECLR